MNDAANRRLLARSLIALLAGAALVATCYFFVDRPVAYFVHDHRISDHLFLKWLTYPPPVLQSWAPAVLAGLVVRRAFGPYTLWQRAMLAAAAGMILADQFRESLSPVLGRYWPETWIDNNPSLIRDGAFGFHPFHEGSAYGSCPSGHAARMAALSAALWAAWPRCGLLGVIPTAAVAVGLIGMNYHFVGDVVAGAVVGGLVGTYTALACGLGREKSP